MRVLIDDGSRHTELTGYGNLSRSIMVALAKHSQHEIAVRHRLKAIPNWVSDGETLLDVPVRMPTDWEDHVLRISTPPEKRINEHAPCTLYTQNALGALRPEWAETIRGADNIIVPSEFDRRVFAEHHPSVTVCHQYTDEVVFQSRPRYREEGPPGFSFLFVGSFSYRKGVDVLLRAFHNAFSGMRQQVHLTLHCFDGLGGSAINTLLEWRQMMGENIHLHVYNGSVTPEWMSRYINRHDCVVTMSRGEGWCMPIHEALLCEIPVIFPDSTAMGECMPGSGTCRVATKEMPISEIEDSFGESMKRRYGFDGNTMFEPDLDSAIYALRRVTERYGSYNRAATEGRKVIVEKYSKKSMANIIEKAMIS